MQIKLHRDQARAFTDRFFPYLVQVCDVRVRDERNGYSAKIIRCLFLEVQQIFERKLVARATKKTPNLLTINLTDAQGLVLLNLLPIIPLDPKDIWLAMIRQDAINTLHLQSA